jgi:pilus assembly protein CpaF
VAASVDIAVHLAKDAHGRRRATEIVALPGRAEGDVVEVAQIFRAYGDTLVRAEGYPPHPERFARAGYDLAAVLAPPERGGWPEIAVDR